MKWERIHKRSHRDTEFLAEMKDADWEIHITGHPGHWEITLSFEGLMVNHRTCGGSNAVLAHKMGEDAYEAARRVTG